MRSAPTIVRLLALFACALPSASAFADGPVINEFLAINRDGIRDGDGDHSDWVEVLNEGPETVDISGYHLTDDPSRPTKWQFPVADELVLAPGDYVLVFASGKNRPDVDELHTNFQLSGEGEYLALFHSNGFTPVHEFSPAYPLQRPDISYGLSAETATFVDRGADIDYLVPSNGALGMTWVDPDFAPGASWTRGTTGIGYDTGEGGADLPAVSTWLFDGDTNDSSGPNDGQVFGGAGYVEGHDGTPEGAMRFDGSNDYVDVAQNTFLPAYDRPAYTLAMWVRGDPQNDKRVWSEGSSASSTPLFTIGTQNRGSTGQVSVFIRYPGGGSPGHVLSEGIAFDGTWHHLAWVDTGGNAALYIDGQLDATDFSYSKQSMDLNLTSIGCVLRATTCCFFDGDIDDVLLFDEALGEDEIATIAAGGGPGGAIFGRYIDTDVGSDLANVNTSLYALIPFGVDDPALFDSLVLRMQYDDGFVAWLNGVEVASGNAPVELDWQSRAAADRDSADAIRKQSFNLSDNVDLLAPGDNMLAIQGLNRAADDGNFLILPDLVASGSRALTPQYLRNPSPGTPNEDAFVDFVADTTFSVDRGFYDAPFEVEITSETPGATIRYTTDGSAPTTGTGTVYAGPILIDTTTTLRAIAYRSGWEPTNVDTQTYIFLDDVIRQPASIPGYPSTWAGLRADYAMDPEVCTDTDSPTFQPSIREDLMAIPTMSIVLSRDDFMGSSRGIYTHPTSRGVGWERGGSVEYFTADGSRPSFQVNCGIRMQGGSSARTIEGKHSFRLVFTERHGPTKLRYRLFEDSDVDVFDTLILRCCSTDSWHFKDGGGRYRRWDSQYIRDVYMRDSQLAMGKLSGRGTHVHLYVNGLYWGLYNPTERPDDSFNAEHQGGEKEDWDVIKDFSELFRGQWTSWNEMMSLAGGGLSTVDAYQRIQGNFPDGTRNPDYPVYLDVENLIDYMILHLWGCSEDWPHHNWYSARDRTGASGGFKFLSWDQEITMDFVFRNRINVSNSGSPAFLYSRLRANPEFRIWFADRVQKHFFHGGVLTTETARDRWMERARELDRAIVGESARWGDFRDDVPDPSNSAAELYTREDHWLVEQDKVINDYIPESRRLALERFTAGDLYPDLAPPRFNQHGGDIDPPFNLSMTAIEGEIHYTLDGTDPRLVGGEVSPDAATFGFASGETLVAPGAPARALVPSDGSLGLDWIATDFDDADWRAGTTGVGYERNAGGAYEDLIGTDMVDVMDRISATVYMRIPFDIDDVGDPDAMNLDVKYDDGYIAYLNGQEIARRNAPDDATWDSDATASHSDTLAVLFERVDVSEHIGLLRNGLNVLAIHGMNSSASSSDMLILPQLSVSEVSGGGVQLLETTVVKTRTKFGDEWSALQEAIFAVDTGLRITEIMYHPLAAEEGSPFEQDEFEFIELQNTSGTTLDMAGVRFVDGITFDFTDSAVTRLAPGEVVVLVESLAAFATRYDLGAILVAGQYGGKLSNTGERITLVGPLGETIQDFEYDDAWHPETDGTGSSLVIVDAFADRAVWGQSTGWRPSLFALGSPGVDESGGPAGGLQLPGDTNQDGRTDVSDAIALLGHLFGGSHAVLACGDGTASDPANAAVLDVNGDGGVNLSDPIWFLEYLFQGGPQPAAGVECILVEGCPNACRP